MYDFILIPLEILINQYIWRFSKQEKKNTISSNRGTYFREQSRRLMLIKNLVNRIDLLATTR